jgi:LmbE family N-acetylglucosaminyl deacetylase
MPARNSNAVVISPHLDDAVLSLGAFLARTARSVRRITILTVFAGNPDSRAPAGGWDRRGGFATEGDAARARRLEDEEACRLVGAEPAWLQFSEADYRASIDEDAIWSAVAEAVDRLNAEAALIPGFPLTNPDHALISGLLVKRGVPCRRLGLYAEQPYRYTARAVRPRLGVPSTIPRTLPEGARWRSAGVDLRDVRTKRRAILAYRSQLTLLGLSRQRNMKLNRMLLHETLRRGEAIMWLPGS